MNKALMAIGLSVVAGIIVTLLFAYMREEWPFNVS